MTNGSVGRVGPADDSPEAGFARDMIEHHSQAVGMADRIRERSVDPAMKALATDIVLTQSNQIGRMQTWLELWDLSQIRAGLAMEWMDQPGPMPGMATRAQVEAIDTDALPDAEVRFLDLMIRHHQAGVMMAQGVLERTDRPEVRRLAQTIVDGQLAEIGAMEDMLAARRGAPAGSAGTAPADGMPGHG